jgi:hypothetical protein
MKEEDWKYYIDKLNKETKRMKLDNIMFRIDINRLGNPNRYIFTPELIEDNKTRCKNLILHKFANINYLGETRKEVYKSFITDKT